MDAALKRPWYRLHWGTVLVVFFVGLGWLSNGYWHVFSFLRVSAMYGDAWGGWPFLSIYLDHSGTSIHAAALAADIGLMLACLLAVGAVVERGGHVTLKFTLAAIMSLVTTVALLLGFCKLNAALGNYPAPIQPELGPYWPLNFSMWGESIPVLFAVGCTLYATVWLGLRAAALCFARLRRPTPAKVEADGSPAQ